MSIFALKKLGSNEQPFLLDFDPVQTKQKLFFAGEYIVFDKPDAFENLASQKSGYTEQAWSSLCIDEYDNMWFEFGLKNSSWTFLNMGWPKIPRVQVIPNFYSKQHSMRFVNAGESKNLLGGTLLAPTTWSSLMKNLYAKKVIPRFPAAVKVNNPVKTSSAIAQGALDITVEADIPTYSEFVLFLKKLNLI